MNTSQTMFLYAVEEMNFTRAAERAFVTQQCLSFHISNLEKSYGTKLFQRRPHLALTAAGRMVYDSLLQIQQIEENLQRMISSDAEEKDVTGEISVGIPTARANIVLADLLKEYHIRYPHVKVRVSMEGSNSLIKKLQEGQFDLVLSVNAAPHENIRAVSVTEDVVYLAVGKHLLQEVLPGHDTENPLILPEELSRIPLIMNPGVSTVKQLVESWLLRYQVLTKDVISLDHYLTAARLCRDNVAGFFCPESILLNEVFQEDRELGENSKIALCRIRGLEERVRVEMAVNRSRYIPSYAADFGEMLIEIYQEKIRRLRDSMGASI